MPLQEQLLATQGDRGDEPAPVKPIGRERDPGGRADARHPALRGGFLGSKSKPLALPLLSTQTLTFHPPPHSLVIRDLCSNPAGHFVGGDTGKHSFLSASLEKSAR